jgi:transposase
VTRRAKRFLTAEQKYDLWVRILTGQLTQSDAVAEAGVDRTTIATLRKLARDGAIAALQASRPGQRNVSVQEASELAKLQAEATASVRW